jgi:uncharacterized RDD family membrane protein YckC
MRFCVKCGAPIASSPDPGSWKAPSGNLYDAPTPSGGLGGGVNQSSSFGNQTGGYTPTAASSLAYAEPGGLSGFGGYPYAEWIDRVLAALIDGGIAVGAMFVLYIIFGIIGGGLSAIGGGLGDNAGGGLFGALGSLACCFGFLLAGLSVFAVGLYNKVFLVSKRGFSIGQGIMKLKVVDQTGNIPPIGTLVIRLLVQVGIGIIPFIGFFLALANALWPLWDEKKQTLHDKAANTFVLKTG